jgi:anaphase-promoting complex subunit 2
VFILATDTNFHHYIQALNAKDGEHTLLKIVRCLQMAQRIYHAPFAKYILPHLDPTDHAPALSALLHSMQAITTYSLPPRRISSLLTEEMVDEAVIILGIRSEQSNDSSQKDDGGGDSMDLDPSYTTSYSDWKEETDESAREKMMSRCEDGSQAAKARARLLSLLRSVQDVGYGGSRGQKVLADVMNDMMSLFIRSTYSGQWESPSLATNHLRQWIRQVFAKLVGQALDILQTSQTRTATDDTPDFSPGDIARWEDMGVARLGALRIYELFDIVVDWDISKGAIEDLKHYTTNPITRYYLTSSFNSVLIQRLLQPGASTLDILRLYISIIRAFNLLDPKGVLLDRVARPIRRYLKDREDTVKVIVGSLLADSDADSQVETLAELSSELTKAHEISLKSNSGELDWDDMEWVPDPIDAAPDYTQSKNPDVIGSLMSLFDTKEAFVKELQGMLGDRLLKNTTDYDQEISVLELLKLRFGDSALQVCQVMLRDVLDSKRVDGVIRNDQNMATRKDPVTPDRNIARADASDDVPQLHAKILSRLFWPTLQDIPFKVPREIESLQERYEAGFESLKQSRKLKWLNGLGHVTVELDLEDRVFKDEVTTWQATVIYAFQSDEADDPPPLSSEPISKTVPELSQTLEMTPSLVRSACLFWVSRRILTEPHRDTFRVLEVLPSTEGTDNDGTTAAATTTTNPGGASTPANNQTSTSAADAAEAEAAAAAKESADAAASAKMNLYWQFIVGMLTNQGAMPLQRIIMMLKIVVPDGFPFSNEELREFLAGMVAKGKLEIVSGGSYRIVS